MLIRGIGKVMVKKAPSTDAFFKTSDPTIFVTLSKTAKWK